MSDWGDNRTQDENDDDDGPDLTDDDPKEKEYGNRVWDAMKSEQGQKDWASGKIQHDVFGDKTKDKGNGIPANMTEDVRHKRWENLAVGAAAQTKAALERAKAQRATAEDQYQFKTPGLKDIMNPGKAALNAIATGIRRSIAGQKAFDQSLEKEGLEMGPMGERPSQETKDKGNDGLLTPLSTGMQAERGKPVPASDKPKEPKEDKKSLEYFVAKARKKKGYLSTILGGAGVTGETTQGKTLLGS
jgi:hypothetical protein